jgi:hypothetical protein
MHNKTLSNNKQAIWIGKQCFLMRNEFFKKLRLCFIIHVSKMNALKVMFLSSKTLKSKHELFWPIKHETKDHFTFSPIDKKILNSHKTLFIGITWIIFRTKLFFKTTSKWFLRLEIGLKFQKSFCESNPFVNNQTLFYIVSSLRKLKTNRTG